VFEGSQSVELGAASFNNERFECQGKELRGGGPWPILLNLLAAHPTLGKPRYSPKSQEIPVGGSWHHGGWSWPAKKPCLLPDKRAEAIIGACCLRSCGGGEGFISEPYPIHGGGMQGRRQEIGEGLLNWGSMSRSDDQCETPTGRVHGKRAMRGLGGLETKKKDVV